MLQIIGIIGVVVMDLTTRWNLLPYDYGGQARWHLAQKHYWIRKSHNWWALLMIFAPFGLCKSLEWIESARTVKQK